MPSRLTLLALLVSATILPAPAAPPPTREAVLAETLHPYTGPSTPGVDVTTLTGKVMTGYQGWFNAEGDGADRGWVHWTKKRGGLAPGNAKVDLWPDMTELTPGERFSTGFQLADGRPAEVFSSFKKPTVLRHFQWMKEHGIDGAFVQRFTTGLRDPRVLRHTNVVLDHCREGANLHGRAYAVMYDLTGMKEGRMDQVIEDWTLLRGKMRITDDKAYLRHKGKPVVTVWGVGFSDNRAYTTAECRKLVEFLKKDGCTVMLGVPTYWRELKNDALADPALHEVIQLADIVSPWTVGRFGDANGVRRHYEKVATPDIAWCAERKLDYLPVLFPGFSWHNMTGKALDQIPRRKGAFLWEQFAAAKRAGAAMNYVAMFDEVDEATAIFKCTNDVPPPGESAFLTYESLPSDHYLHLTGMGGKMLRGEIPVTDTPPERK